MKDQYSAFLKKLRDETRNKRYIIGAGVGSGLSAKGAVAGGADLLAVYSTAAYRVAGLPTALSFLPYDNCNKLTMDAFPLVKISSGDKPVLMGLGAHDPRMPVEKLLDIAEEMGADGVVNEFFLGIYGGLFQKELESLGMGFSQELKLIKESLDRGLMSLAWAFSANEAARFAALGSPFVGVMITEQGAHMKNADDLDAAVRFTQECCEVIYKENKDAFVFIHGSVVESLQAVEYVLQRTPAGGFFAGSAGERIPVVPAIANALKAFGNIKYIP